MKTFKMYREAGSSALSGQWIDAVLMYFLFFVVGGSSFLLVVTLPGAATLLLLPAQWALLIAFLRNHRDEDAYPFDITHLLDGYRDGQFSRVFLTLLLMRIYTYLWSLLLFVPGIIKGLAYAMTPYILYDYNDLRYNDAITLSECMMRGHKGDLLCLYLSFIGWFLLCLLTFGIGFLWLVPYFHSTVANFYEDVKAEYEAR